MGAWLGRNEEQQKSISLTSQREVLNPTFSPRDPQHCPHAQRAVRNKVTFISFLHPKVAFLDAEQQTSSKLGKEYIKAVYCHLAYLTYMQSTSCEILGGLDEPQA